MGLSSHSLVWRMSPSHHWRVPASPQGGLPNHKNILLLVSHGTSKEIIRPINEKKSLKWVNYKAFFLERTSSLNCGCVSLWLPWIQWWESSDVTTNPQRVLRSPPTRLLAFPVFMQLRIRSHLAAKWFYTKLIIGLLYLSISDHTISLAVGEASRQNAEFRTNKHQ